MSGSLSTSNKNVSPIRCSEKPWDLWVNEIGHASPLRDEDPAAAARSLADSGKGTPGRRQGGPAAPKRGPTHCGVTRLRRSTMCLYGQFPNTDLLNAALCYMCGMTVKCSAAHRHLVEYHSAVAEPILPPPPPAPTVKLKSSHSKSKPKKETPPSNVALTETDVLPPSVAAPSVTPHLEVQPAVVNAPPRIVLTPQEMSYFPDMEVTGPKCTTQSELKVSVDDNDLPVVSIQDNTDLPLADDIIEIMNSEGIQSIEDIPEADTAAWKNLMQDFGAIQDMTLQSTNLLSDGITTHELYDASGTPVRVTGTTYTLSGDDGTLQYTQPVTLPPTLAVENSRLTTFPIQCAPVKPVQLAPVKPRLKSIKSSKSKFQVREYDPNKHCGVITGETQKPCTRSLTCKAHTLSLRRLVEGRIKSFDALLAEHKAAKQASLASISNLANQTSSSSQISLVNQASLTSQATLVHQANLASQASLVNQGNLTSQVSLVNQGNPVTQKNLVTQVNVTNQVLNNQLNLSGQVSLVSQGNLTSQPSQSPVMCNQNNTTVVGLSSPIVVSAPVDISAFGSMSPDRQVTEYYNSVMSTVSEVMGEGTELIVEAAAPVLAPITPPRLPEPRPGDVCWYPNNPRPLAACTFSSCHMGSALLLGKRLATVRSSFKSTLMQPHTKSNHYNFNQNSLSSMSKTIHVNNTAKPATPEVRKLIMSCPAVSGSTMKLDPNHYYNSRPNGHLFSSKRPLLDEYEDIDKCMRTAGPSVSSIRNKVAKHMNQTDLMELNFMFDPLMADEKC